MAYWVMRYRSNQIMKGTGRLEAEQIYAGPFPSSTEAWAKAHELHTEHERKVLSTPASTETEVMFGVLSDEEMAEARGLGVRIIGKWARL